MICKQRLGQRVHKKFPKLSAKISPETHHPHLNFVAKAKILGAIQNKLKQEKTRKGKGLFSNVKSGISNTYNWFKKCSFKNP